ncbi:hypothetical protein M378DRAFT_163335 [Amanita muscaria Koide BX008]|uniref:Uncharacterized protein n=1 Tax=Amanita muscaria (strain Koide BX008) TaxID=946122 RepID=A0A0C2WRL4_AMAMK|nr:hypothetical protein M378DRAFT_163335 [Amanita muscaria Koide BX008]
MLLQSQLPRLCSQTGIERFFREPLPPQTGAALNLISASVHRTIQFKSPSQPLTLKNSIWTLALRRLV